MIDLIGYEMKHDPQSETIQVVLTYTDGKTYVCRCTDDFFDIIGKDEGLALLSSLRK